MSKLLIDQIKELLKHIETNPDALNKFEKNSYFQVLKKAKIIDFKSKQTLANLPTDKPKTKAIPRLPGSLTPDSDIDMPGHNIVTSESKPHKIKVNENLYNAYVRHYGDGSYDVEVDHENPPDEAYDIGWDHFEKLGYMSGHGFNEQGEPDLPVPPETKKSETYYKDLVESTLEKAKKSKKPFHGYNPKKHAKTGGLNDKYRKKVNRETGSDLKRPSKDKGNPRHKSFCARMKGVKGPTSKEGKLTPKGAALKRWNCSKNEHSDESLCKKSRCWAGYEPTPGKKPYSKGSCRPIKKNDYFSSLIKKTFKHD